MGTSYASAIIPAPAERVWRVVREFNELPSWHPGISASTVEADADPAATGCVRRLELADGGVVRERLDVRDDREWRLGYTMLDGPFAVRRYVACLRVAPVTESGEAFVEWSADFDADATDEPSLERTFGNDVFAVGLGGLRAYCAAG